MAGVTCVIFFSGTMCRVTRIWEIIQRKSIDEDFEISPSLIVCSSVAVCSQSRFLPSLNCCKHNVVFSVTKLMSSQAMLHH